MKLSERSKIVLSTHIVLIIIIALMFIAEGLARVRQYIKYGAFGHINELVIDAKSGLPVPIKGNNTANIKINSLGFRGPEIEIPKPEKRLRIGFLGASTTFCAEVSSNNMVWAEMVSDGLEKALPGISIDYVNGAVQGYTTRKSLVNLEHRIASLQPDLIVIYHATNDLSAETRDIAIEAGIKRSNLATATEEKSWLEHHSLLWMLTKKNLALLGTDRHDSQILQLDVSSLGAAFRKNLVSLVNKARKYGAKQVVLVTFSTHLREDMESDQVNAAMVSARYYMPYLSADSLLEGFLHYNNIIRDVARETDAILIENENSIPGDPEHFVDSVHFTDKGSQLQAERIISGLLTSQRFLNTLNEFKGY